MIKAPRFDKIINYVSVAIVLFLGIVVISGYFDVLERNYRIGFGLVIIAYACVRFLMIYFSGRESREKP